ncbi:MAG: IclR family transcriptional regulator [Rhodobacteraceae bacterium]|nr:IclR family transcriptional regulator [Paracoccaceae bacterium]
MTETRAVMGEKPPHTTMPSVDKALLALLSLADAGPGGLPLSEIASRLKLNKSSLHVTLSALRFRNFVEQTPTTGFYRLGSALGQLSLSYLNSLDIRATLRPAVQLLAEQLNEVCHISVLDGHEILYIDKIDSNRAIQPGTRIGMRLPALTTAMGRAMIAQEFTTYHAFRTRFENALIPRTPNAPRDLDEEWKRICDTRERGYGIDNQENVEGLVAVAIAVLSGDRAAAAVSVVSLADNNMDIEHNARVIKKTLATVMAPPLHLPEPRNRQSSL